MSRISKLYEPMRENVITQFLIANIIFALLFRLCELNLIDVVQILFVVNVQIVLGGLTWMNFRRGKSIPLAEFVGMGGAIGFGLAILSSQIFRTILPQSVAWLILPALVSVICRIQGSRSIKEVAADIGYDADTGVIFAATLIALSTSWYWLISTAVSVLLWAIFFRLRQHRTSSSFFKSKSHIALLISALIISIRALKHLSLLDQIRNPLWWNLRFGVMQDPDQIFYESMVNSTRLLGNQGNIFFTGLNFYYHWFSYAWESTLGSLNETQPFVITAIAGPAIVLLVLLCLVCTVAKRISSNALSGPAAVLVVSMMCAGPIPFLRVLHPYSFSFNFSLIFLYAILVVLFTNTEIKTAHLFFISFYLCVCLFGSKVSFVPILVIGSFCNVLWSLKTAQRVTQAAAVFGASILATVACFSTMYSLSSNSGSNYHLSFADILWQKANIEQQLPIYIVLVSFVFVTTILILPTLGVFLTRSVFQIERQPGIVVAVSAGVSGLILGFLLSDPAESNAYFIQAGLALLVPISVAIALHRFNLNNFRTQIFFVVSFFFSVEGARLWPRTYRGITGEGLSPFIKTSLTMGIPTLIPIFCFVLVRYLPQLRFAVKSTQFLVILLIVSSAGSYYANAGEFFNKGVWAANNVQFANADVISGSPAYRNLLLWLRNNSELSDLVATNRYCSVSTDLPSECQALWNLTSAISGRRMLSEGVWTIVTISGLESELATRVDLVDSFVDQPSLQNRSALLDYGVRWVVADFAVAKNRNWGEFAEVRFENKAGAILELVP